MSGFTEKFRNNLTLILSASGLCATILIGIFCYEMQMGIENEISHELEDSLEITDRLIQTKFIDFEHGLEALGAVYTISNYHPKFSTLQSFSKARNDYKSFTGALGFGFAREVTPEQLTSYELKMQKEVKSFNIHDIKGVQTPINENKFVIESIEPFSSNGPALGLNLASEPNRKQAAIESKNSRKPTLSKIVRLVQAHKNEPGFLFYYPLYKGNDFQGWVYAPILASEIYKSISSSLNSNLLLSMYELNNSKSSEILNTSSTRQKSFFRAFDPHSMRLIRLYGRDWILEGTLEWNNGIISRFYPVLVFILSAFAVGFISYYLRKRLIAGKIKRIRERAFFQSIFNTTQDGVLVLDPKTATFTSANPATLKIFGLNSLNEIVGKSPLDFSPQKQPNGEKSEELMKTLIENIFQTGNARFEWTFVRNGEELFITEVSTNYFAYENEPVIFGICRDLTQIRKSETELKNSHAWNEAILNGSNFSIIATDKNGVISSFNATASKMLGYQADELIGKATPAIIHDPVEIVTYSKAISAELGRLVLPGFDTLVAKAMEFGSDENEWSYLRKDGSRVPVRLTVTPLFDGNLNHVGFLGTAQDLSQMKSLESEYKQVMDALNKSAIVTKADVSGKILEANQKFCEISGYSLFEIIGQDHRIVNSGMHSKEFFKDLWSKILSGETWVGEIQNKKKNGDPYWVQTAISPLFNEKHQVDRFISIRFDVTEKKLSEFKLVNSTKMASLGEMAGGIAHEINNPLAAIQGKTGQIKRMIQNHSIDETKLFEHVDKIEKTATRIAKIVRGLRSFSRNAENDPMSQIPISKIVEDTLELCQERFKNHSIDLQVNIVNPTNVECRAEQIGQVLMNLLSNAFDVVDSLSDKWVKLDVTESNGLISVSVTDSGRGIPQDVVNKMMQPFFTTKEVGKGTGLGLSISKGIIEAHNGQFFYDSSCPNTRFTFTLPTKQAKFSPAA